MDNNLKEFLINNPNAKTAIIDNNFLSFCTKLKINNISIIEILKQYDVVIVPSWVNIEINDSIIRTAYLQELRDNGVNVCIIDEAKYIDLANDEELNILKILMYSAHKFGPIIGYMKKEIIQNQEYEDIDYEFTEWINMLYHNWPIPGKEVGPSENKRIQKKNAGEISISLLAYDTDCYNCIYCAEDKFNKDQNFKDRNYASITFKSNDFILYELVKNNHQTIDFIKGIIDNIRDPRKLKYSRRKDDNSYEDKHLNIDNSTFVELICDESLHIIF